MLITYNLRAMQNRAKANLYPHVHPYSDPTPPMKLSVIGSMATKGLLAALCQRAEDALGCTRHHGDFSVGVTVDSPVNF